MYEIINNNLEVKNELRDQETINSLAEQMILSPESRQDYINTHRTSILDTDMTMFPKPKTSCNSCYGRGFSGVSFINGIRDINLCHCIKNRMGRQDIQFLNYGEFKAILNNCDEVFKLGGKYGISTEDVQGTTESTVVTGDVCATIDDSKNG